MGFDPNFYKEIDFGFIVVKVKHNPVLDHWVFKVGAAEYKVDGSVGRVVYDVLCTLKWAQEARGDGGS